jgi:hypothetical protein
MKFRYEDMSHPLSSFHLFRCKTLGEAFFSNTVTGLKRFPLVSINQLMLLVRMASTSGDIYERNVQNLLKIHDQKNPNVNLEDMKDKTFKVYHDYYLQCLVENTLISSAEVRDPQMMTVCNIAYSPHEFTADFTKDLELFIRLIKVVTLSKAVNDETTNRCLSSIAQSRQLIVCESARLCLIDPTSALAAYLTWITKIMGRIYNEVTMTLFPHVAPGMSNACTFTLLQFMYTLGLIANNSQTQIYVQNIANGTLTPSPAGTYTTPNITIDAYGRILSAINAQNGGVVNQVLHVIKTNTHTNNGSIWKDWEDLTLTITPISSTSRILIMLNSGVSNDSNNSFQYCRLVRKKNGVDSDFISITEGNARNSERQVWIDGSFSDVGNQNSATAKPVAGVFMDQPSVTTSVTYKCQTLRSLGTTSHWGGSANTSDANRCSIPTTFIVAELLAGPAIITPATLPVALCARGELSSGDFLGFDIPVVGLLNSYSQIRITINAFLTGPDNNITLRYRPNNSSGTLTNITEFFLLGTNVDNNVILTNQGTSITTFATEIIIYNPTTIANVSASTRRQIRVVSTGTKGGYGSNQEIKSGYINTNISVYSFYIEYVQ